MNLLQQLEREQVEKLAANRPVPEFQPGDTLRVGVKVVEGVDKSGFEKAAAPIQDELAKELGPHAVKILELVRNVK